MKTHINKQMCILKIKQTLFFLNNFKIIHFDIYLIKSIFKSIYIKIDAGNSKKIIIYT